MLEFVRKAFRGFIGFILWLNLILFIIGGGVLGKSLSGWHIWNDAGTYIFLGGIVGLIVGLLVNITLGGFITTILNIDKNIELLVSSNSVISKPIEKITDNEIASNGQ